MLSDGVMMSCADVSYGDDLRIQRMKMMMRNHYLICLKMNGYDEMMKCCSGDDDYCWSCCFQKRSWMMTWVLAYVSVCICSRDVLSCEVLEVA